MKAARLTATTLEVSCPHCGVCQADPDGGTLLWEPLQIRDNQGVKTCQECRKVFTLRPPTLVFFPDWAKR